MHGGVIGSLVDAAGTFAAIAAVGRDCVTVDFRVDFLRPVSGGTSLTARGRPLKAGRTLTVSDVEVLDDRDQLVAAGRVTMFAVGEPLADKTAL